MNSTVSSKTDTDTTLVITLGHDHLDSYVQKAYEHLRSRVKVAGFRPGKAPNHIVERELGAGAVQSEVLEHAVEEAYAKAIVEHGINVIAPPEVKVTKFVPFDELEFTATVDVMPEIKLADYKNIKLKHPEVKIEDAEIEATVEDLRRRLASKQPVERPAGMGDELVIDFDGTKDGQKVEGAAATDHVLVLGSQTFIPGFEEQLVGLSKNEEKSFDIVFPKDYSATDLAGQKVNFKVKVKSVGELVLPPVNEEFVQNISTLKTVDELKTDIRERITAEKTEAAEAQFEQDVLDEIVAKSQWKAPKRLVDAQVGRLKNEMSERLSASGLDLEKYLEMSKKTMEELDKELLPTAEKRVGLAFILNRIAEEEGIKVSPANIDDELGRLKQQYADPQMQQDLNRPEIREDILNHLMTARTIEKVVSYIKD